MNRMMIDFETLDTKPTAIVLSLGAVVFGETGIHSQKHWLIAPQSQEHRGRTMSVDTVLWWLGQSKEAQDGVTKGYRNPPDVVIGELRDIYDAHDCRELWGFGSDFDNAILTNLCNQYGMEPFPFRHNRCLRTIVGMWDPKGTLKPTRTGVHHNALDDALHQVGWLQAIIKESLCTSKG